MKKYIFTETQLKKVIDNVLSEQMSPAVYENPTIPEQMKKIKPGPGGRYAFSSKNLKEFANDHSNRLYVVKKGDTISTIVQNQGANSEYNIYHSNDLLQNNPKNLRVGDVICMSMLASGR
jgi:hypothetical protein